MLNEFFAVFKTVRKIISVVMMGFVSLTTQCATDNKIARTILMKNTAITVGLFYSYFYFT
jgi:hypothetical protein